MASPFDGQSTAILADPRGGDTFLATWRGEYDALDRDLEGLALDEVELYARDVGR
jgi:hypothetical protein